MCSSCTLILNPLMANDLRSTHITERTLIWERKEYYAVNKSMSKKLAYGLLGGLVHVRIP